MNTREYCCYTRPYSEIEGLQLAHTLLYSASAQPEGIVLELCVQQGGGNYTSRVVCPDGSFAPGSGWMYWMTCTSPTARWQRWRTSPGKRIPGNLYHLPVLIRKTCCIIQN